MPAIKTASKDMKMNGSNQDKTSADPAPSEAVDEKGLGQKASSDGTAPGTRRTSVGTERMGNIRNKFESGEALTKKVKKKNAPKIKYAGAESAKTKFMKEATKSSNGTANGPKKQKQFTPPPEGVTVGVLESQPQPRAPDIISAEDSLEPVNLTGIGENTKSLRAKFKHMEEHGGKMSDEDDDENSRKKSFIDEFQSVGPEATRNARARWKDIESGKVESEVGGQRTKIDIHDAYGGVYENEPEKFENIARAGDDTRDILAGVNAREMREQFLRNASESAVVKKDPSKLLDFNNVESGIFENEPTRREDVVHHDDETDNNEYPSNSVKWASEAKNRFMQEASKAHEPAQRTQPVSVVDNLDSVDGDGEVRFASQAKQAFLERQRANQEALENKARPGLIDIWGEKCAESGVFENTPASRRADVVAAYDSDEEEDEDEEVDEEEEEADEGQ